MIARRKQFLGLRLVARVQARKRSDGTFSYRFKTYEHTYLPLGEDADGVPGSGAADANRKALDLLQGRPVHGTLAALVAEYLKSAEYRRLAPRTQSDYHTDLKRVERVFGQMAPSLITPQHIARYRSVERSDAPVRANRELAALSTVFQFGIEMQGLPLNPCRMVRRNPETPRSVAPEWADIEAVLKRGRSMGRGYRVACLLALTVGLTGFRRQDVIRLTDFQCGEDGVRVAEQKRKAGQAERVRLVRWSGRLRDIVAEARTIRPAESSFVFTTEDGSPYSDSGFKTMWGRVKREHVDAGGLDFTAHDLRAFYVTETKQRGGDPQTHANPATTARIYDRRRIKRADALE